MDFITLQDVKEFEALRSPDQDKQIELIVEGVNAQFTSLLGADNNIEYAVKTDPLVLAIFLDTEVLAKDIVVTDEDGNTLTGLTGWKGYYTFTNPYTGTIKFTMPPKFATVPADLKMAALYLARHYRKDEYKSSESGSGQAVSYVSLTSNIPKHVMAILSLYRPI